MELGQAFGAERDLSGSGAPVLGGPEVGCHVTGHQAWGQGWPVRHKTWLSPDSLPALPASPPAPSRGWGAASSQGPATTQLMKKVTWEKVRSYPSPLRAPRRPEYLPGTDAHSSATQALLGRLLGAGGCRVRLHQTAPHFSALNHMYHFSVSQGSAGQLSSGRAG